jgi:hypothetical protein
MKKYLLLVVLCITNSIYSQDLIGKIPADTPFLMMLNGKKINEKVPVKKLKDYPWIKNYFDKEFNDFPDDLSQTGIDFTCNQYQYYTNKDSVKCFVILLPIKDKTLFEKLIKNYKGTSSSLEFKQEKNYTYATQSKSKYIAWNDKFAVLVNGNYSEPYKSEYITAAVEEKSPIYNEDGKIVDYGYAVDSAATMVVDAPVEMTRDIEVVDAEVAKDATYDVAVTAVGEATAMDAVKGDEEPIYPKKSKLTKKKKVSKNKNKSKKGKSSRKKNRREVVEEVPMEKEAEQAYDLASVVIDSVQEQKNKEIEIREIAKVKNVVDGVFNENFNTSYALNPNSTKISKFINPKAEAFVWADVSKITEDIYSRMPSFYKSYKAMSKSGMLDSDYYMNAYFEKEKVRLNQITAPRTQEARQLLEDVMDSKMDKKLMGYIGNDVMGYYSMSTDTEALLKYEYSILRNTLNTIYKSTTGSKVDNNNIDVVIDAVEILLDEKAIAALLPGNAIFVMHDLKSVTKEYTTYEYDDNYEKTEKINTKNEMSPEFSFLFSTKNDAFIDKLLKLPLNKKEVKIDYQAKNGYYAIHFGKDNILENLYFGVKNGVVMMTTRKQNIDNLLQQNTLPLDNKIKNRIAKNNGAAWIDLEKALLISKTIDDSKKTGLESKVQNENNYYDIALKNVKELSLESKFKKGVFSSELIYSIKGNHANSLEYFLNVFDELIKLDKKKKEEVIIEKTNEDTKE